MLPLAYLGIFASAILGVLLLIDIHADRYAPDNGCDEIAHGDCFPFDADRFHSATITSREG